MPSSGTEAPVTPRRMALPAILAAVGCLLALLPYLPELFAFFSSDDWVWIGRYGSIPAGRFWEFLSPNVVWFYRPLQAWTFAAFYQWFGLSPTPWNAALFLGQLTVCSAVFWLLWELTGKARLASLATVAFAFQSCYLDILMWKSNLCTIQWALFTVLACAAFTRSLRTGERSWRWIAVLLCALDFLTKESAVSTPLLFALLWLYHEAGPNAERKLPGFAGFARRGALLLWPAGLVTALYLGFHTQVRNVYPGDTSGYTFSEPLRAVWQVFIAWDHALISPFFNPALLQRWPLAAVVGQWIIANLPVVPIALIGYGLFRRDRLLLFGLAWFLVADVPTVFLTNFHSARFYYLPAVGSGLLLADLLLRSWDQVMRSESEFSRLGRPVLLGVALFWLASNVAMVFFAVQMDIRTVYLGERAFGFLRGRRASLPPGSIVLFVHAPDGCFHNGLGAEEMVQLALQDPTANGVLSELATQNGWLAQARDQHPVYTLDLIQPELTLKQLSSGPPAARTH